MGSPVDEVDDVGFTEDVPAADELSAELFGVALHPSQSRGPGLAERGGGCGCSDPYF
jgi:hypothetical protein